MEDNVKNNIDLDGVRDAVYELEGLLELARLRQDKTSELMPLIKKRLEHINDLFSGVDVEETSVPERGCVECYVSEDDAEPEDVATDEAYGQYTIAGSDDVAEEGEDNMTLSEPAVNVEVEEKREPVSALAEPTEKVSAAKPAFCINDRFRFRRELFHNSDSEFSAAMDLVATMDSYEEAEEYFLGDLGWNPEDEAVVDFMSIIGNYFGRNV